VEGVIKQVSGKRKSIYKRVPYKSFKEHKRKPQTPSDARRRRTVREWVNERDSPRPAYNTVFTKGIIRINIYIYIYVCVYATSLEVKTDINEDGKSQLDSYTYELSSKSREINRINVVLCDLFKTRHSRPRKALLTVPSLAESVWSYTETDL